MAISEMSLRTALKRKFGGGSNGARAVMRALGVDENLLKPATSGAGSGAGNTDAAKRLRQDIEMLLGELDLGEIEIAKILAVLDEHAPLGRLDDADPHAERARELAGDDDEEERRNKLLKFLRGTGISDEDCARAMGMLPKPATGAMDRRPRRTSGSDDGFFERYPGARAIEPGPSGMAFDRRRKAPAPSELEADLRDFYGRFPQAERIQLLDAARPLASTFRRTRR